MTAVVEGEIMTYLHEDTSPLCKWVFLESYHQIRTLFIYTAPKSMFRIWVQKQAGCKAEAFLSLTEPRLFTSTVNFPFFVVVSSYSTVCSLFFISWQQRLAGTARCCFKGTEHDYSTPIQKNINSFFHSRASSVLFERNCSLEHPI